MIDEEQVKNRANELYNKWKNEYSENYERREERNIFQRSFFDILTPEMVFDSLIKKLRHGITDPIIKNNGRKYQISFKDGITRFTVEGSGYPKENTLMRSIATIKTKNKVSDFAARWNFCSHYEVELL